MPAADNDMENFDLRKLFENDHGQTNPFAFLGRLDRYYPNQATHTTMLGYWVSIIDVIRYRSFNLTKSQFDVIYDEMLRMAQQSRESRVDNPIPRILEERPEIDWKVLIDAERDMRENEFASIQHLTLAMSVCLAPRRNDDSSRLRFCRAMPVYDPNLPEEQESNWCVIPYTNDPVLLDYRAYKTSGKYGRKVIRLATTSEYIAVAPDLPILGDILRGSYGSAPRDYVFSDAADTMSVARVARWTKAVSEIVTGAPLGIQVLRRLYSTYCWSKWGNNDRNLMLASELAAHSIQESRKYTLPGRIRVDPDNNDRAARADVTDEGPDAGPDTGLDPPATPQRPTQPSESEMRLRAAVEQVIEILRRTVAHAE